MRFAMACAAAIATVCLSTTAPAQTCGPGVSDTEIGIGNTTPYSGPASKGGDSDG